MVSSYMVFASGLNANTALPRIVAICSLVALEFGANFLLPIPFTNPSYKPKECGDFWYL